MAEIAKCGDRRCACRLSRAQAAMGPGVPRSTATKGAGRWLADLDDLIGPAEADEHGAPAAARRAA